MGKRQKVTWQVWWCLMRPHTLTAAVMPVLIGTSIAYADGSFRLPLFGAMMIASVLIQAAVNMFNEYFDYKRGLDSVESVGIGGAIVRDELTPATVLTTAIVFFSLSIIIGLYICIETSWWIAAIGAVSMLAGYFYSAGRHPIAYTALGETAAGIFMGPVIVLISYFIQRGTITFQSVLLSIPISILVAAILLANNIRDADGDAQKGRRTLAILWGREKAITILYAMFMASFIWILGIVLLRAATPWCLLVFLGMPKASKAVKIFRAGSTSMEMLPAMKATSQMHSLFGVLMSIGIVLGKLAAFK